MHSMLRLCVCFLFCTAAVALEDSAREKAKAELRAIAAESTRLSRAFNLVHKIVGPSVVSIHTREFVFNPWTGKEREIPAGEGSGFVVATDPQASWILTNAHVVLQSGRDQNFLRNRDGSWVAYDHLRVLLHDNRETDAAYVGVDVQSDLALLRVPIGNLPTIEWADSDQAHVGDWVVALGYPFGVGYSATAGIVSATDRSTGVYHAVGGFEAFIQTDAPINPGNSGGPLVDLSGHIVGVNSNIYTRSGGSVGLGFAIPANLARIVAEDLRTLGKVRRGAIGIRPEEIDAATAQNIGLPPAQALRVSAIDPLTPAEQAGLKVGDVLLAVNRQSVASILQFRSRIAVHRPGDRIQLSVWRDRAAVNIDLTIADKDELDQRLAAAAAAARTAIIAKSSLIPVLGVRVLPDAEGLLVVVVEAHSLAAQANITPGDRIVHENSLGKLGDEQSIKRLAALREGIIQILSGRQLVKLRFRG